MFSDPLSSANRGVFYPSRVNCGPGRPPPFRDFYFAPVNGFLWVVLRATRWMAIGVSMIGFVFRTIKSELDTPRDNFHSALMSALGQKET